MIWSHHNEYKLRLEEERDELREKVDSLETQEAVLRDDLDLTRLEVDRLTVENEKLQLRITQLEALTGAVLSPTRLNDMQMIHEENH